MQRDLKYILKELDCTADWISLREVNEKMEFHIARDGRIEKNYKGIDQGIMIEVLVDGQFAYTATNSYDLDEIKRIAQKAVLLAKESSKFNLYKFTKEVRSDHNGSYQSKVIIPFEKLDVKNIHSTLIETTKRLKQKNIVSANATIRLVDRYTRYVSSSGADIAQSVNICTTNMSVTITDGGPPIIRSIGENVFQGGLEYITADIFSDNIDVLLKEANELLNAQDCPNEKMDLLLNPDQLYLQLHESIGHPLELDRIIGDERNYAGWSFIKTSDFGKLQYGSKLLNVTFDPTIENELASYKYDDVGTLASKKYLIKNGLLVAGIGGLESQSRTGLPGVSSSRATSWNRPPIDRMANINIEAGNSSFDDMIAKTEKGIYMQTNRSWSIDDYRNKFQFGCEYARLIENGKLTKVVKNPNYRGISTPFWNNLIGVGNQDTYEVRGSYYCGKGEPNQIIRVGHAVPICLFKDIEVFGGA